MIPSHGPSTIDRKIIDLDCFFLLVIAMRIVLMVALWHMHLSGNQHNLSLMCV